MKKPFQFGNRFSNLWSLIPTSKIFSKLIHLQQNTWVWLAFVGSSHLLFSVFLFYPRPLIGLRIWILSPLALKLQSRYHLLVLKFLSICVYVLFDYWHYQFVCMRYGYFRIYNLFVIWLYTCLEFIRIWIVFCLLKLFSIEY